MITFYCHNHLLQLLFVQASHTVEQDLAIISIVLKKLLLQNMFMSLNELEGLSERGGKLGREGGREVNLCQHQLFLLYPILWLLELLGYPTKGQGDSHASLSELASTRYPTMVTCN